MSDNILDKLTSRAKVIVYKPEVGYDDRNTLCGEPMQSDMDEDGNPRQFFVIPAHQADYINKAFMSYIVTEPFIPGVDDVNQLAVAEKEFACQVEGCGKVFKSQQSLASHMRTHA